MHKLVVLIALSSFMDKSKITFGFILGKNVSSCVNVLAKLVNR